MKWRDTEKQEWFKQQTAKRSYQDEVLSKLSMFRNGYDIEQYGALPLNPERYPLYLLKSKSYKSANRTVLVTGGVHGYETSGVQGALEFLSRAAGKYFDRFNIVCTPCISPWAYETINRWNPNTIDPNRSFYPDSVAEECRLFLAAMTSLNLKPFVHFDLHETTDTDNTVFRPALAARDGVEQPFSEIPDGFYLVGDTQNPQPEFQKAIIDRVREVTHIAPPDKDGNLIGDPLQQDGVVNYDVKKYFLCAGFSDAKYTTTTEVYPDSPKITAANCIDAQIAAITGGLDYLLNLD